MSDADKRTADLKGSNRFALLPRHLLNRMASILELRGPVPKRKLRERVEAALREYKDRSGSLPATPKELRRTFVDLTERAHGLHLAMKTLGPSERAVIESAIEGFPSILPHKHFGFSDAVTALEKIGILFRESQRCLPRVKRGPQKDIARWFLVHRLGVIYATSRRRVRDDGKEEFEMPTRRHNPLSDSAREYGPFRDFVIAAHAALGFADPERGTDDVIRSVWGGMGKKR